MSEKYHFKLPEKLSFDEIASAFVSGYEDISEETKLHTLQVYAQYNCFGSGSGITYFNGSGAPYCIVGEYT